MFTGDYNTTRRIYSGRGRRGRGNFGGGGSGSPNSSNQGRRSDGNGGFSTSRGRGRGYGRGRGRGRESFSRQQDANTRREFTVGYLKLKQWSEYEKEKLATELYGNKEPFGKLLDRGDLRQKDDWTRFILKILQKVSSASGEVMKKHIFVELSKHFIFWESTLPNFLNRQHLYGFSSVSTNSKMTELSTTVTKILVEMMRFSPEVGTSIPWTTYAQFSKSAGDTINAVKLEGYIQSARFSATKNRHAANNNNLPPNDFRQQPSFPTMEEMQSVERPFLRPIKTEGSYEDTSHYLDVQFRLLKEDLVCPLRDGIKEIVDGRKEKKHDLQVYNEVEIFSINCTNAGLTCTIHFMLQNKRPIFWKHTRKLIFGTLLCFSNDRFKTMIFATVSNREPRDLDRGLLDVRFLDGVQAYNYFRRNNSEPCEMVECPSYFEAYKHVLEGLKEIDDLAMEEFIVKGERSNGLPEYLRFKRHVVRYDLSNVTNYESNVRVCSPQLWPSKEKFIFNPSQYEAFKHALTNKFAVLQGPPGTGKTFVALKIVDTLLKNRSHWQREESSPMLIVCYTNHALDQFLNGLIDHGHRNILRVGGRASEDMQEYSLATALEKQRRDKTQSSSVGRAKYKSHKLREEIEDALEPYLESLQHHHKKLVNGKLMRLQNLRPFINARILPHFAKYEIVCAQSQFSVFDIFLKIFDMEREDVFNLVANQEDVTAQQQQQQQQQQMFNGENLLNIEGEGEVLTERWAVDQNEFKKTKKFNNKTSNYQKNQAQNIKLLTTESGFVYVLPKLSERKKRIQKYMKNCQAMSKIEVDMVGDPWDLAVNDRWRLYRYWLSLYLEEYYNQISKRADEFEEACSSLKELKEQEDEEAMRGVDVIAMTTTCAARYRRILKNIGPKIVVIEEAAEVLEAHVITSLTADTEHLILIGDHQQLRPNPSVFELAKKYNLELSLFERMVNNGMQCQTLNVQHRMRPEISRLIKHIYPDLRDHAKVKDYPHVKGVSKDVVFISHDQPEQQGSQKSKSNRHEAEYMVQLCKYLLLQGYKPSQITVLTGYSGQLSEMKKLMPKATFEGVRATTVDNFQGEENDVILLSLVRSNSSGSIGFLGTDNRVNVALSRAKHGLFVIGNFDLLEQKSRLWKKIVGDCRKYDYLSTTLELFCQNHPSTKIVVQSIHDFEKAPDGGCMLDCKAEMRCGHRCWKKCHPADPEHNDVKCKVMCPNKCKYEHLCPELCHYGEKCHPCETLVVKQLPCGHSTKIACHQRFCDPKEIRCLAPCEKIRSVCGHKCKGRCYEECNGVFCNEKVNRKIPECGHIVIVKCSQDLSSVKCRAMVSKTAKCQHQVSVMCCASPDSVKCQSKVLKILSCGHSTEVVCSQDPKEVKCQKIVSKVPKCGHMAQIACSQDKKSIKCMKITKFRFGCECVTAAKCFERNTLQHQCPKPSLKIKATKLLYQLDRRISKAPLSPRETQSVENLKKARDEVKQISGRLDTVGDVIPLKTRLVEIEVEHSLAVDPFKTMLGKLSELKITK